MEYNTLLLVIYICYLVIMSLIALYLYCKDKKIATKQNKDRIKEKTLLGVCVYGGAIGSYIGRLIAHHKTNKIYFTITIYLSLILQIAGLGILILLAL